ANCGEVIDYRASQAGQVVECPKCKEKSQLPEPDKLGMLQKAGPPTPEFRNCEVCGTQLKFAASSCPACDAAVRNKRRLTVVAVIVGAIVVLVTAGLVTRSMMLTAARQRRIVQAAAPAPRIIIEQPRARGPKSIKDL